MFQLYRGENKLHEERIYIGLSCYPILFSTFLNKIRLKKTKKTKQVAFEEKIRISSVY